MAAAEIDMAAALALMDAQANVRENLTTQAQSLAANAVREFAGWYSAEQITGWATDLAKRIDPLQRVLALSTDAYLARLLSLLTGSRNRPVGRIDTADLRPGMTHAGAYGNIADAYRWQQAQLDTAAKALVDTVAPAVPDLQSPLDAALKRAASVADMDMQLAARGQSNRVMTEGHDRGVILGYRRVIHPELSRTGTCGLCIAASSRIYHVAELMPIHHECHCLPSPITEGRDIGSIVNDGDLARLYAEAGSTGRADLKRTRYQVTDAGALGPLLEKEGARRGLPGPAAPASTPPAKTPAQKLENLQRVRDSLTPALTKADELAASDPSTWTEYRDALAARVHALDLQLAA